MTPLRKPSIHPAIQAAFDEGVKAHAISVKAVSVLAKVISEMMEELHGGEWSVQVEHQTGFVAISRDWQSEVRT